MSCYADSNCGEVWAPVPLDEFSHLYQVSSIGRVKKLEYTDANGRRRQEKIHKTPKNTSGYPSINLRAPGNFARKVEVHALVAGAFLGRRPDRYVVCHNNSVSTDNRVENLRYDTQAGNMGDCVAAGTHNRGERNGVSKLTVDQVLKIRAMHADGESYKSIAETFGVAKDTVSCVVRRRRWRHI